MDLHYLAMYELNSLIIYAMEHKENVLGIKITTNCFIAIEPVDQFGDLTKYDFIYTDYMVVDKNLNTDYFSKLSPLNPNQKYIEINGWKLLSIAFPGNWGGQWYNCTLEDRFGKTIEIKGGYGGNYHLNYMYMIRESLDNVVKFTKENPCVEYHDIVVNGILKPSSTLSVDEFHHFITSVDEYILKYQETIKKLTEEEKELYSEKLKQAITKNLKNCLNLDIIIE